MSVSTAKRPSPLVAVAQALAVDATIAEVTAAWRADGVPSLLLKGPTIASWLYTDGAVRPYGDADLLVPPQAIAAATSRLRTLGFAPEPADSEHATPWRRAADGARVDLHHTLWNASAPPGRVWAVLAADATEAMSVGGVDVAVPTIPARALFVATHAAQHEVLPEKPLEDLRRALDAVSEEDWRAAAALADRLGLLRPLATGLSRLPLGSELAAELPLVRVLRDDATLTGDLVAVGIARVAAAPGMRAKARIAANTAFPPPDVLRWWSPVARRGRRGLAAAYVGRAGHLAFRALPAAVRWRRSHG